MIDPKGAAYVRPNRGKKPEKDLVAAVTTQFFPLGKNFSFGKFLAVNWHSRSL